MNLKEYATQAKTWTQEFLETQTKSYPQLSENIIKRLITYATAGKGLRGGLVLAQHNAYNGTKPEEAKAAAIAVELFHSGILMIDDIIDCDTLRRGLPTMHYQLQTLDPNSAQNVKKGESFAMCVSLITTYLGQGQFSKINNPEVIKIMTDAYVATGFAEMQELLNDSNPNTTKEDIFDVYINKTGRYTISMPSMIGAVLANAPKEDIEALDAVGKTIGILFQLKDDLLELEGTTEEIGKSVTTDIFMNNKTYPRFVLKTHTTKEETNNLATIYGTRPTDKQIQYIKELHKKYATTTELETTSATFKEKATTELKKLSQENEPLKFLIAYNATRKK